MHLASKTDIFLKLYRYIYIIIMPCQSIRIKSTWICRVLNRVHHLNRPIFNTASNTRVLSEVRSIWLLWHPTGYINIINPVILMVDQLYCFNGLTFELLWCLHCRRYLAHWSAIHWLINNAMCTFPAVAFNYVLYIDVTWSCGEHFIRRFQLVPVRKCIINNICYE